MTWTHHSRSSLAIQAVLNIVESEGIDPSLALKDTGIEVAKILDIDTHIADQLEIQVIENALALLSPKAGYGVIAGRALRISDLGVWGLTISTSPNLRSALEATARFSELPTSLLSNLKLSETENKVSFIVDMAHLPNTIHRFMFERYFTMMSRFIKDMVPRYNLSEFELGLPFKDPVYEAQLATLIELPIKNSQRDYFVSFPKELLDHPFSDAAPMAHAHFMAECEKLLSEHKGLPNYAQKIHEYMLNQQQFSPKLEKIASHLHMSARSLRRRLNEEGLNFKHIVQDTKMTLAKELLTTGGLPVKVVADQLGYSESASFVRAFKVWFGRTPADLKKQSVT